ncbi:MAG: M3 family oligoendopeptidase [Acidobacteriota bacterium]
MTITETPQVASEYQLSGWDLSELLPDTASDEVDRRIADLEAAVQAFEGRRDGLQPTMDRQQFLATVQAFEGIFEQFDTLLGYASLWFSADTQSRAAQSFRNRIDQVVTGLHNRILFFEVWWKSLDDAAAEALLPTVDEHADHRHFLSDLRRAKPFTLAETSEQLVNLKDSNGIEAVMTLYSMLTNRLEYHLDVDGEEQVLTRDALMGYVYSPRPELREAAYRELYRTYEREATILGQIYINRVRDWSAENLDLRGFASPIAVRNLRNDIPDQAVEVLLEVAAENAHIFRRYFRMKAGWLGLERLRRYDLYAPITPSDREISYQDAVSSVLATFRQFHPTVADLAERVFRDNHIDSEIRKGKRGGAFCSTVLPRFTPWVLVNYNGRVRDVATLAHELGHAVHSMLAEHHSCFTQHASLPLAETASVFAEMLMTDRLLRAEQDPLARRELLASALDDFYATVMRQAYFVRFEIAAHEAVRSGASVDELNNLYMAGLEHQFGDSIEVASEFQYEWLSIPHIFHTPFYCYAYSFGQLLVLSLYRRYLEEGEAFKPGYLKLLSYGGSARPEEILTEAGIDMTDADFWRGGFRLVEDRVDELAALES